MTVNTDFLDADLFIDPLPTVPRVFKEYPNWVTYQDASNKAPIVSGTGRLASSSDPATWVDYKTACENIDWQRGYRNLGFVTDGERTGNLVGVDLDGCRNPDTRQIADWAKRIICLLGNPYTEVTPSGYGLRSWVTAKIPATMGEIFKLSPDRGFGNKVQVEVFQDGKYFTMTGYRIDDVAEDVLPVTNEQIKELFTFLDSLVPAEAKQRQHRARRFRFVSKDGRLVLEPIPPDPGFKALQQQVGWRPLIKRMNNMSDIRFHNLELEPGEMTYCPMPQHQPRSESLSYSKCFGLTKDGDLVHCFGCGFSGDLIKTIRDFDAGLDGGQIEYATMYDVARKVCEQEGLDFDPFFPKKAETPQPAQTDGQTEPDEEIADVEEPLPDFPRLSGALSDLSDALYPDIPYEFKMVAAVTHWGLIRSGLDKLETEPHLQPRFYVCFIKEPGWGKTAALNEIRQLMHGLGKYSVTASVDSGPALVDELADVAGKLPPEEEKIARLLIDPDELADLFEKSKVTAQSRNSLFMELLKLYESNRTGNRSRKAGKSQLDNAHLAIVGGATPEGYTRMWTGTGGGSTGLQSRMVPVTTTAPKMPVNKRVTDATTLTAAFSRLWQQAALPGQAIKLDQQATEMLQQWWGGSTRDKPSESRAEDMVKRLLIVLAVTNDTSVIGRDLMAQAIKFGDYIIAVRERFNPADSYSWVQAFENDIIKVARKHPVPMTLTDFRRFVQPTRKPGGLGPFLQACKNVVAAGILKTDGVTHKGTARYRI